MGTIAVDTLLIAYPLGNCAGVERSVVSLDKMVDEHGEGVYCYHEIVESPDKIDELLGSGSVTADSSVSILMQTTLAEADWNPVVDRIKKTWPGAWMPKSSDICFATTNRQKGANMLIDEGAEAVVVVTATNSSNGMALTRVVQNRGIEAYPVESARELPDSLAGLGKLGITAAASAPADLIINHIMARLNPNKMRLVFAAKEEKHFPLPRELR